jgi:acyl carrier protein
MTEADIYFALQNILNTVMRRQDIIMTPLLSGADIPGWDSFKHVNVIVAVEDHFRIALESSDIDAMTNFGDLAQAIARLTGQDP